MTIAAVSARKATIVAPVTLSGSSDLVTISADLVTLSASMGLVRAARKAGKIAEATVTTNPATTGRAGQSSSG